MDRFLYTTLIFLVLLNGILFVRIRDRGFDPMAESPWEKEQFLADSIVRNKAKLVEIDHVHEEIKRVRPEIERLEQNLRQRGIDPENLPE